MVKGFKMFVRPDTSDEFICYEVIKDNTYRKLNILPGDVVLDIGANIGTFAVKSLARGAIVHSYEPDPDNFQLLKDNIALNNLQAQSHINECAVTGTDEPIRSFSYNVKRNKGAHSLVAKGGRESFDVQAVNFQTLIETLHPQVVKLDIEGGEVEIVRNAKHFNGVRELIMEFHHAHLNENKPDKPRPIYEEMLYILQNHFEHIAYIPEPKKAWCTNIYCVNT
jgi:FkbM family methyltransferase